MERSRFQQGLDDLRDKLLRMGGLAEQAIDRATEAYRTRDAKFCQMVFTVETAINQAQRDIDELALDLLAMQQPMAIDLRFIMAVVKINIDLERVGDQAVNIAQRVLDLISEPEVELPVDIPRMASSVSAMVQRALESFLDGRAEIAESVLQMDNIVDRMKDEAFVVLVQCNRIPSLPVRRWMFCSSRAIWSGLPIIPPTSPRTLSSGCAVQMYVMAARITFAKDGLCLAGAPRIRPPDQGPAC